MKPYHPLADFILSSEKASRNVTNPTSPRSTDIADRARSTSGCVLTRGPRAPRGVSSSQATWGRSAVTGSATAAAAGGPAESAAATPSPQRPRGARPTGRRRATTVPTTNTTMSRRRTHAPPRVSSTMMAGTDATRLASDESRPSRALADASSLPPGRSEAPTTRGTREPLVTRYTFDSTSMANASGNSRRLPRSPARTRQMAARQAVDTTTVARRAPRLRSMIGPRKGATTAKGAMVSRR